MTSPEYSTILIFAWWQNVKVYKGIRALVFYHSYSFRLLHFLLIQGYQTIFIHCGLGDTNMRLSLTHGSSVTRQAFIDVHIDLKGTFEMHSTNFAFVLATCAGCIFFSSPSKQARFHIRFALFIIQCLWWLHALLQITAWIWTIWVPIPKYIKTRGHGKLRLYWWNWQKIGQFIKLTDRAFFVKIEKLLVKNKHFNTKLWTTLGSPRNARLNQGTCYSQGKVSSFQGICLLSYLNGWRESYLRTTKGCWTRYLKSSGLYYS